MLTGLAFLALVIYALGVMISGVVRSPLTAAALVPLVAGGLVMAFYWATALYLPGRWGPWLGIQLATMPDESYSIAAVVVTAVALFASFWGFVRARPLSGSAIRVVTTFVILLSAGSLGAITYHLAERPPVPESVFPWVDPTGHWMALSGERAVAVMEVDGGRRRLMRGTGMSFSWSPRGDRLAVWWGDDRDHSEGGWGWIAEPATGRLHRLRLDTPWGQASRLSDFTWSPRGTYLLVQYAPLGSDQDRTVVTDSRGRTLPSNVFIGDSERLIGWTADETAVYTERWIPQQEDARETEIARVNVTDGKRRLVARVPGRWDAAWSEALSPDGRWLVGSKGTSSGPEGIVLVDTHANTVNASSGAQGGYPRGWAGGSRYLWVSGSWPGNDPEDRRACVIDTQRLRVITWIFESQLRGELASTVLISPAGDRVLLTSHAPRPRGYSAGTRQPSSWWVARADGTGLRLVAQTTDWPVDWTHDGDIIGYTGDDGRDIIRLNPDTGVRRVVTRALAKP
jgi:hypothetical protein